jgi:hypothetical protein
VNANWSPALTTDSFRHTATCSTVISHNREILPSVLATRAAQRGFDGLAGRLLESADAAGQARLGDLGGWRDAHVEGDGFRRRIIVTWISLKREGNGQQRFPLGLLASRSPPAVDVQGRHAAARGRQPQ